MGNGINSYNNVFSKKECLDIINVFNDYPQLIEFKKNSDYTIKRESVSFIYGAEFINTTKNKVLHNIDNLIYEKISKVFNKYRNQYGNFYNVNSVFGTDYLLVKYLKDIDEAPLHLDYPVIMYNNQIVTRIVGCITYLNDVENGGETIFTQQKEKIKPECGKTTFFPINITHPHLVAKSISNDRYVLITWFYIILE